MKPTNQRRFATHETWTEEPDVFCVRFTGIVRAKEFREILDHRNAWAAGREWFFFLGDIRDVTSVDPDVRQVMTEERAFVDHRQIAVNFGANFTFRVLADMVLRAQRLIRPNKSIGERIFVATEAEARAFIEKRRQEIVATTRSRTTP